MNIITQDKKYKQFLSKRDIPRFLKPRCRSCFRHQLIRPYTPKHNGKVDRKPHWLPGFPVQIYNNR